MQNFKILRQIFNFFTPQYLIVRGVGGGSRLFFWLECYSIGNSGPHAKIWNPTTNFQFFHPPISHSAGGRGGNLNFFSDWNVIFLVTQEPMQNFKTVAQTLLGETAHFGFCPPKIGFCRGFWGSEIFSPLESSYLCYLGAHAKFWNGSFNTSGRNSPFWLLSAQNQLF